MKLYTRRDMARLASIGVAGIATGGLAVEFPSSVSSRARGLVAMKNIFSAGGLGPMTNKELDAIVSRVAEEGMTFKLSCDRIGDYAFQSVKGGTFTVSIPNVKTFGTDAFAQSYVKRVTDCESVQSLDNASSYGAFRSCVMLEEFGDAPNCTVVGVNAFNGCRILRRIYMPNCVELKQNAFITTLSLVDATFGVLTSIGTNAMPAAENATISVGNTCDSLMALANFSSSLKTSARIVCSDGYITYENGAWTKHPN